jgi:hypothetical protein
MSIAKSRYVPELRAAWRFTTRDANNLPRTIALAVALATLASNAVASALLSQLESDPYGLTGALECYLHLANVLSVFGFIGSLRVCPISHDAACPRASGSRYPES